MTKRPPLSDNDFAEYKLWKNTHYPIIKRMSRELSSKIGMSTRDQWKVFTMSPISVMVETIESGSGGNVVSTDLQFVQKIIRLENLVS
ncbi:hypothetical protein TNCV_411891 [Trichonephila clavipes]|nr:hypothetical protein TNCV_411891 [Trichonephila clavipes]